MYHFDRWKNEIQSAGSEQALAKVIKSYSASLLPSDVSDLPQEVHRILVSPDADLAGAAVELLQQELKFRGSDEARRVLNEISHTFVVASTRLSAIRNRQA